MSDSTRLGRARGRMLPVAIVAAAALAMLVVAPFASAAAPSPISSGTTTLTINGAFAKKMKKAGITLALVKPSKFKGNKVTFPVTGGELELPTGTGTVTHNGGLKLKWGMKSVTLKSFTVSTATKSLSVKVGGKTLKAGSLAGASVARLGFGDTIKAKKLKLTAAGAKALNKALTPAPTKVKIKKKGKTVVKTVITKPAFKANMLLGSTLTEVEPTSVNLTPTGTLTFSGATTLLGKLADVGVKLETIAPTTAAGTVFTSPITGGTISPLGTSGVAGSGAVSSSGGLKLVQVLPTSATTSISTAITLGAIDVDLAAKTATVEVIGESNAESEGKKPLNLGNLGRSSIADLTITSTPSPATRTVTVSATGTVQPVAAEVLEGFVKVYQGYYAAGATKEAEAKGASKEEAAKIGAEAAAKKTANDNIVAGEPLGSFAFVATGE